MSRIDSVISAQWVNRALTWGSKRTSLERIKKVVNAQFKGQVK